MKGVDCCAYSSEWCFACTPCVAPDVDHAVGFAFSLPVGLMDVLCSQVTLGVFGHEEAVISNPLSPGVIKDIIYSKCSPYDEREAVLQQELVIHIGWIISNTPELFSGMLKMRVGSVIFTF